MVMFMNTTDQASDYDDDGEPCFQLLLLLLPAHLQQLLPGEDLQCIGWIIINHHHDNHDNHLDDRPPQWLECRCTG